jgi:L-alanine-DL-glutamate epimerase-like enolase superfamily enzyme
MRTLGGAEALVARVVTTHGVAGFGFSLGLEATPARDMAAWDALGRSRNLPLYALFGRKTREHAAITSNAAAAIDPFELLSIEAVLAEAGSREAACLLAPNGHPWELSYCAALAAALPGSIRIAAEASIRSIVVSESPGIGIDWSIEPGFATLRWYPAV